VTHDAGQIGSNKPAFLLELDNNRLFRWFVGLSSDEQVWGATTFTKNRDRLRSGDIFQKFMTRLLNHPQVEPLLSDEHFSVDGTLVEAWASQKSFRPEHSSDPDGSDFHGQTRKNATHANTSDPDSRLYRKATGHEAKLSYMGHVTMGNGHGLAVAGEVTQATGTAERGSVRERRSLCRWRQFQVKLVRPPTCWPRGSEQTSNLKVRREAVWILWGLFSKLLDRTLPAFSCKSLI